MVEGVEKNERRGRRGEGDELEQRFTLSDIEGGNGLDVFTEFTRPKPSAGLRYGAAQTLELLWLKKKFFLERLHKNKNCETMPKY
jgi:hypothetical protein